MKTKEVREHAGVSVIGAIVCVSLRDGFHRQDRPHGADWWNRADHSICWPDGGILLKALKSAILV